MSRLLILRSIGRDQRGRLRLPQHLNDRFRAGCRFARDDQLLGRGLSADSPFRRAVRTQAPSALFNRPSSSKYSPSPRPTKSSCHRCSGGVAPEGKGLEVVDMLDNRLAGVEALRPDGFLARASRQASRSGGRRTVCDASLHYPVEHHTNQLAVAGPQTNFILTPFASRTSRCSTQSVSTAVATLAAPLMANATHFRSEGSKPASMIGWGTSASSPSGRLASSNLTTRSG